MKPATYYWCLTHERVEAAIDRDDIENSLGPYDTADDAANWKAINEARAAAWQAEDDAWEGDAE